MKREWSDDRIEALIGRLLQYGVFTAALLVLVGGGIYLARHGGAQPDYRAFQAEPARFSTASGILRGATDGSGRGLIQLGLLLLIATPVARVALALVGFAAQGDRLYVVIAALVLAILAASLL